MASDTLYMHKKILLFFQSLCIAMEEVQANGYCWPSQSINDSKETNWFNQYYDIDVLQNEDSGEDLCNNKRARLESSAGPWTKACREKMRRDRLNERFTELYSILEPGSSQNSNKATILRYATNLLNHLRLEAKELTDKNKSLQETNNFLKEEKMELEEEKLLLKAEKIRMEEAVKSLSIPSSFAPQFAFYSTSNSKPLMCPLNYMSEMCQWTSPASVDTCQDHILRPPIT